MSSLADIHPLPVIKDKALQNQLFVHRSLLPVTTTVDYDNNERLAFFGDQVVHMCVTDVLFERLRNSNPGDLDTKRARFVSVKRAAAWSDSYELVRRLQAPLHQLPVMQSNKAQKTQLFRSHLAVAFLQDGYEPTRNWLRELMELTWDEAMEEEDEDKEASQTFSPIGSSGYEPSIDDTSTDDPFDSTPTTPTIPTIPTTPTTPTTNYSCNPVTPPRDPLTPTSNNTPEGATPLRPLVRSSTASSVASSQSQGTPKKAVSALHERCAQKKFGEPVWSDQKTGKDNDPTYVVTVRVDANGMTISGEGIAKKKQVAKEQAAQAALEDLGWL